MIVREAVYDDLVPLVNLYSHLHDNAIPEVDERLMGLWEYIMSDVNHHIVVCVEQGEIVSSCVIIIVPNLTHNQRPYALVENVVTHRDYRNKGYATAVLSFARDLAIKENCYKIMLMTGSKDNRVLSFYEKSGYNRKDKTAFIKWL